MADQTEAKPTPRKKGGKKKERREVRTGVAHIQATFNNTIVTLTDKNGNVVFRLGFAASRRESRQMVAHGHFQVNGRKVTVPSFLAKVGDVVQLRPTSKMGPRIDDNANAGRGQLPQWLDLDVNAKRGVIRSLPLREDIQIPVSEQLIVELYSK